MTMHQRLHERRKELGLTLEDVGRIVGVGKSTVRKWETGDIENMKRDKIALLAKALQVSPAFIMDWEEETAPSALDKSASSKYNKLVSMIEQLSDEEWQKIMDYAELLLTARQKHRAD